MCWVSLTSASTAAAIQSPDITDPESYTWDLLDDDLRQRLNVRNYVSLSRDRRLGITASPESSWLQSKSMTTPNFRKELGLSLAQFGDDFDYAEGQKSDSNGGRQHCSLFDLKPPMPGVMTKEEVERDIDLDRWKIKFHSKTYTLDVRQTFYTELHDETDACHIQCLLGWDESDIRDRTSPRGSLAEFAACIGPDLVRSIVLSVGS